ncbi:hypothetical protein [Amycolatopsis samaneae]|uniref:SseB protein N-terminal domain-containing protein n=1 Tax=Amycolatopsis samaneae TaxID=664691 RepID=A0ABW5GN61_9PSEU
MEPIDSEDVPLASIARQVWAGHCRPAEFFDAFNRERIFAQRPEIPGILVTDTPDRGCWTRVFSTIERLAAHAGECEYLSTTGADFMQLVPTGVGVMLDPDDEHRIPVLSQVASAAELEVAWARFARERNPR